jgi:hypothetical protein
MSGLTRDDHDLQTFHVDWAALRAGLNPWKRGRKVAVDPFLVAKAVKAAMRQCPDRTATGSPLVWNDYAVFLDLADWSRIKKLEATLVRDIGAVVEKELTGLKAEMVGPLSVRLVRDESGAVRPGGAIVRADFTEAERLAPANPAEMTVRVRQSLPPRPLTAPPTVRVPDDPLDGGARQAPEAPLNGGGLRVEWPRGQTSVPDGSRIVLGRSHRAASPGFVALTGASARINKRQLWIEAGAGGVIIGRFSEANPVQVAGRLIQSGGQIAVDRFPLDVSLSNGEMNLTIHRIERH